MATTERRKSISLFFGFSKQEAKADPMADSFPKLRRKLQKVTKQIDMETNNTSSGIVTAPAPDGGVQTVKVPGDDLFLSTKYEARPPPSRDGSKVLATAEAKPIKVDKRSHRDSKTRFFSRASSTSRIPNSSRSASCTRADTTAATRPESSRGENNTKTTIAAATVGALRKPPPAATAATISVSTPVATERPTTATSATATATAAGPQALSDAQDETMAQEKAAQAAAQARALQLIEAHERVSAQEWLSQRKNTYSNGTAPISLSVATAPPSASRSKRAMPPLTVGTQAAEKSAARQYPRFHRPYSHSQPQNTFTPKEADTQRPLSTANRSPYASRKSVLAPVAVPTLPSSAVSDASSTSLSSPTSAAFTLSSASLALTSATSFTQSHNNLPLSPPGSASSCTNSPNGSVIGSSPFPIGRRRNKYDFDNESTNSSTRVVPELSYLSCASSRDPHTPDSPVSTTSSVDPTATKMRRKVKTPVFAIGQLESGTSADEAMTNELKQLKRLSHMNRNTLNIQTPPDSPVFGSAALGNNKVELSLLQSKSSIECIAEEYRALLTSRNSQSTDAQSELNVDVSQQPASTGLRSRNSNKPPPLPPLRTRSNTLGINPSKHESVTNYKPPPSQPNNLSLQICVDLLTRELSSAVLHRSSPAAATAASQRAASRHQLQQRGIAGSAHDQHSLVSPVSASSPLLPTDSAGSALQILVMIEAYERLRDQLVADAHYKKSRRTTNSDDASGEEIESMFGLWLKSLYRIHDSLTSASEEDERDELDNTSNSEYDSAEEEI